MRFFSTKILFPCIIFSTLMLMIPFLNQKTTTYAQNTATVIINNNTFTPQTLVVPIGTTVTWRNDQNIPHTVTSDVQDEAESWNMQLNKDQTFSKTFTTPGTYTYHCTIHPSMTGTIIVTTVPTSEIVPSATPPQNISPTFACLGACPTPTTIPYNTPTTDPCAPHVQQYSTNFQANSRGKERGKSERGRRSRRNKDDQISGLQRQSLLEFLLFLLQQLFNLLGASPTPPPPPAPIPTPTQIPTALPTALPTKPIIPTTVVPTIPPPTPCPSSVTPTGSISIDDLKYNPGTEALRKFDLIAEPLNGSADTWVFDSDLSMGKIPGPEWRVTQGDHVRVNFVNKLPVATGIHWHGVRVFASQDGIDGITQNAVQPGGSFQYDFIVPDAGTYFYHPHQDTKDLLPKGLIGAIIVSPRIPTNNDNYQRDFTIAYHNVKSPITTQLQALPGEKVRLRLIDAREPDATGTLMKVALVGTPFKVRSIDGQDINEPQEISSQIIEMGMGNRFDLEFIMPATGKVQLLEQENLQTFTIGQGAAPTIPNLNTLPVFSYLNYGLPTADTRLPKTTFDAEYTLNIGQNLTINGQVFPKIPDIVVKEGELIKITYVNNSTMIHPMHLHGHFYSVLKVNGVPVTGSPIHLDTVIVNPGETVEVAVLADNPGIWMLHCHVLSHGAGGLSMFMKYDNVYTPYKYGPGTGNEPH